MSRKRVLIVDDDVDLLQTLSKVLTRRGYEVIAAKDGVAALKSIKEAISDVPFMAVVSDVKMPRMDGTELLRHGKSAAPSTEFILLTGYGTIETAVTAMKAGAYDYLTKPPNPDELLITLDHIAENQQLRNLNVALQQELSTAAKGAGLIGRHPAMQEVYEMIARVSESDINVLIYGETGTGKELVAKAIHRGSNRAKYPFIVVNCAALPLELLETELFGNERGAFTDARERRYGKFEVAHHGTLFLDEVGTMSPALQQRLLRAAETKSFERVGGTDTVEVDVRILSATNADLMELVRNQTFREDLYYRLNTVAIQLPPMRDRRSDIPLLARHFLEKHKNKVSRKVTGIHADALAALQEYAFPGNARELEHMIQRALVLGRSEKIEVADLPAELRGGSTQIQEQSFTGLLAEQLGQYESKAIRDALSASGGNQSRTARALGINRTTLIAKMKKYDLKES
ncbi:MAG: hypothetical protein AUJ92_14445 [Armatimonadetes bacterium CG2_30_59_28]|nr:sigma-54-dependent Fis family transcriptional regulator [Armatimonadota bacterium]OIO92415.1 MAG: hypothetical protein AUJ92_14445 [Armatimonadetes bacterium CG2_30_59_28]PIU63692.1 MAG: hypothetical protein COS85_15415 [Armatimonadetes bacterium CG07_land_8_20_14_0_80_59_28]PIX44000.1 MAG: hypothetical protein COZ56_05800 [Armatimonadetes bacterium CG_4_8_14_3_um_filter_58_9]PIY37991.1 MAG: hypothetical protein COZ05_21575 [Armatimonadetes bacterium CG_4_10_14_3_um_filter_59_10]PJB62882.1 